ncbi:GDSL-type esterase/lipase family protein [Foetidibacter luteolus]|uniref:GDSL-type esterase/lipase family protein n=1 Tax=Foetidibacter luteolus TaxID=2608880 RepID=UPI001F3DEF2B|nr:GDSL-type esterase/lipase family protein [Foetidibacter luteolus]
MVNISSLRLSAGKATLFIAFVMLLIGKTHAQQPPFYNDIQKFKQQDSLNFPPGKAILLVGSSSFTKWTDVQQYFPSHTIINRGFGGSSLPDLIHYENDVIFPYKPRQIIIYCGENDFAASDTVSVATVVGRFKTLFNDIRSHWKKVRVDFVSMKPSPSRQHLWPKFEEANGQIKAFLETEKKAKFIDVYNAMFNADGKVMEDIFVEDRLHMNEKGYAIWQKIFEPYLKD